MKTILLLLLGIVLCSGCNYSDTTDKAKEMSCTGFDCLKEYVEKDDGAFEWKDTGKRLNGTCVSGFCTTFEINDSNNKQVRRSIRVSSGLDMFLM